MNSLLNEGLVFSWLAAENKDARMIVIIKKRKCRSEKINKFLSNKRIAVFGCIYNNRHYFESTLYGLSADDINLYRYQWWRVFDS
jgi:hypothetical protein